MSDFHEAFLDHWLLLILSISQLKSKESSFQACVSDFRPWHSIRRHWRSFRRWSPIETPSRANLLPLSHFLLRLHHRLLWWIMVLWIAVWSLDAQLYNCLMTTWSNCQLGLIPIAMYLGGNGKHYDILYITKGYDLYVGQTYDRLNLRTDSFSFGIVIRNHHYSQPYIILRSSVISDIWCTHDA